MLDKKSKKVLKVLNNIKNDDDCVDDFDFLLNKLPKLFSEKTLLNCLDNLKEYHLITYKITTDNVYIDVLYDGQIYKELEFSQLKLFIKRSIITPIIVAILTTLLTLYVTYQFNLYFNNQIKENNTNSTSYNGWKNHYK